MRHRQRHNILNAALSLNEDSCQTTDVHVIKGVVQGSIRVCSILARRQYVLEVFLSTASHACSLLTHITALKSNAGFCDTGAHTQLPHELALHLYCHALHSLSFHFYNACCCHVPSPLAL